MFDSPMSRCEVIHQMVLTDQTQAECVREHDCPPGTVCPLAGCFYEVSGISEAMPALARPSRHGRPAASR